MKSGKISVAIAGIVVAGGIYYAFRRSEGKPGPLAVVQKTKETVKPVYVDELAKNPEKFPGEFVLRGLVAGVKKSAGVFGLVDSREFELCGVVTCSKNIIPVKFNGKLPLPETTVNITGRMIQGKKGRIIAARRVELVK